MVCMQKFSFVVLGSKVTKKDFYLLDYCPAKPLALLLRSILNRSLSDSDCGVVSIVCVLSLLVDRLHRVVSVVHVLSQSRPNL